MHHGAYFIFYPSTRAARNVMNNLLSGMSLDASPSNDVAEDGCVLEEKHIISNEASVRKADVHDVQVICRKWKCHVDMLVVICLLGIDGMSEGMSKRLDGSGDRSITSTYIKNCLPLYVCR